MVTNTVDVGDIRRNVHFQCGMKHLEQPPKQVHYWPLWRSKPVPTQHPRHNSGAVGLEGKGEALLKRAHTPPVMQSKGSDRPYGVLWLRTTVLRATSHQLYMFFTSLWMSLTNWKMEMEMEMAMTMEDKRLHGGGGERQLQQLCIPWVNVLHIRDGGRQRSNEGQII